MCTRSMGVSKPCRFPKKLQMRVVRALSDGALLCSQIHQPWRLVPSAGWRDLDNITIYGFVLSKLVISTVCTVSLSVALGPCDLSLQTFGSLSKHRLA